jgi:hypothetical protein
MAREIDRSSPWLTGFIADLSDAIRPQRQDRQAFDLADDRQNLCWSTQIWSTFPLPR